MTTPWYHSGLRFTCTGCGRCCRGHGYVWMDRADVDRLAAGLGMTPDDLGRRYLRAVGTRVSLTEKDDGDCVFWSESDGCTVYDSRPAQCRTFPFWPAQLRDRHAWVKAAVDCPGMNDGRLYEIGEIDRLASGRGETDGSD